MKAARCALFALVLYEVSNRPFVNGFIGAIAGDVLTFWDMVDKIIEVNSLDNMEVLKDQVSGLSDRINSFEQSSEVHMTVGIENLLQQFQTGILLSDKMRVLNDHIKKISDKFELLKHYANRTASYSNFTLEDFATKCVTSGKDGLRQTFLDFHSVILQNDSNVDPNLLKILADDFKGKIDTHCFANVSHQSLLYHLYNRLTVAEIKGLAVMQFSYMLLTYLGKEMQLTQNSSRIRLTETMDAFRTAMSIASPDVWRCDPPFPIEKSDYMEVHFLRAYVILQTFLDPVNTGCGNGCPDYKDTHEVDGDDPYDYFATISQRQPNCRDGELHNCEYYSWKQAVCLTPNATTSGRRYDYIEHRYFFGNKLGVYGNKEKDCDPTRLVSLTSAYPLSMKPYESCDLCICTCLEPNLRSTRFFHLGDVYADVLSNKVVTAIRFVRIGRRNFLQIEEGELLEEGKIANTTRWLGPIMEDLVHGLTWSERTIDLDDLVTTEPGHCLTGVRLQKKNSHLRLEIRTTPFNFTTGKLIDPLATSWWHGNDDTTPKKLVVLKNPDRSTLSRIPSTNNFGKNQYVEFVTTDMDKDAGQSTVPFIDTQPVIPNPRTLLAGAGIYNKGKDGFGGFIALKLKTYNLGLHLSTDHSISD